MISMLDKDNIVMLGDLHFGKNKFSDKTLASQMRFFHEQLFPYMEDNSIDTIIQVGDVFDNRIVVDIEYLDKILKQFFDILRDKNITFICIVGNHDIYHKSTREYTILNTINRLYDNVHVINERTEIIINDKRCYFVPWILPNEDLKSAEITGVNYLFGHFEIRNFEMTKGHLDDHSILSPEFFKKKRALKGVYSGHYHIKAKKDNIQYLGTPYWLDWGDYDTERGFFVIDKEFNETFVENKKSDRYVKIKYDDTNDKPITISGLDIKKDVVIDADDIDTVGEYLRPHKIKFFINATEDNKHEEYIYLFKQQGLDFEITNNVEISNIIGEAFVAEGEEDEEGKIVMPKTSKVLIHDTVKKSNPELIPVIEEIFREIEEEN